MEIHNAGAKVSCDEWGCNPSEGAGYSMGVKLELILDSQVPAITGMQPYLVCVGLAMLIHATVTSKLDYCNSPYILSAHCSSGCAGFQLVSETNSRTFKTVYGLGIE